MNPISSTNSSIALSLLVKVGDLTPAGRQQSGNAADDILKDASSGDDSDRKPGKFIIGNLGTFDTLADARNYVTNNDKFSAKDKADWFAELDQIQRNVDSVEEFKNSDLYEKISSGELQGEIDALKAASGSTSGAERTRSQA